MVSNFFCSASPRWWLALRSVVEWPGRLNRAFAGHAGIGFGITDHGCAAIAHIAAAAGLDAASNRLDSNAAGRADLDADSAATAATTAATTTYVDLHALAATADRHSGAADADFHCRATASLSHRHWGTFHRTLDGEHTDAVGLSHGADAGTLDRSGALRTRHHVLA